MKPLLTSSQGRLIRALVFFLSNDGKESVSAGGVVVESIASEDWSSLTFAGERHRVVLRLDTHAAQRDVDTFDLPNTIVTVAQAVWQPVDRGQRLTLDLLAVAVPARDYSASA